MIDWNKLEADRKAGTPGPWCCHLGDDNEKGPVAKANARRIERVPDLEALALAGRELAEAADAMSEAAEHDIDNAGNGWVGMPYSVFREMEQALAKWKAAKGETND